MHSPLIGMVGFAQAGKDTFAGFLGYDRRAFADKLRDLAYESNPFYRKAVLQHGYEYAKANIPGIREYLQDLGVAVRDNLGPDTWVNAAFLDYDPSVATVFTDVRFPNEIEAIRSRGGLIVRIDRRGHGQPSDHISETAWQGCNPDEHYTFADGALHHMKLAAKSLRLRLAYGG